MGLCSSEVPACLVPALLSLPTSHTTTLFPTRTQLHVPVPQPRHPDLLSPGDGERHQPGPVKDRHWCNDQRLPCCLRCVGAEDALALLARCQVVWRPAGSQLPSNHNDCACLFHAFLTQHTLPNRPEQVPWRHAWCRLLTPPDAGSWSDGNLRHQHLLWVHNGSVLVDDAVGTQRSAAGAC